jgi:hypothetical protein
MCSEVLSGQNHKIKIKWHNSTVNVDKFCLQKVSSRMVQRMSSKNMRVAIYNHRTANNPTFFKLPFSFDHSQVALSLRSIEVRENLATMKLR